MWNELIKIINYEKIELKDKEYAQLLLSQMNTAGGRHLMKKEITYFIEDMTEKYGIIPTKSSLEKQKKGLIDEMESFKSYWVNKQVSRQQKIFISKKMHEYTTKLISLEKQIYNLR